VATAVRDLLEIETVAGPPTLHLGGPERLSRYELGHAILRHHGLEALARASSLAAYEGPPRAPDTSFDSGRTVKLLRRPPRTLVEILSDGTPL
jgi:dTDP-4-dehydrorhamnose reductase